jgi:acetoin:2,6-dichlorophenolindophenol oxidoreductase subunit beta
VKELKFWQAINEAMHEELARDERVTLAGIDAAAPGGAFSASRGLLEKFGALRVRDTPISEAAIAGLGVGAAMNGLRPIIEIMFMDFLSLALEQLVGQGAKQYFMSAGRVRVPVTVRTMCAAGAHAGPQHAGSVEAWVAHVPGLKVVWPSTPGDAKALLKSAVRDDNPVIVIENLSLWTTKGPVGDENELIEIGKSSIKRAGRDVTLVCVGSMVLRALAAAEELSREGIDVEVLDLRTISPLDREGILASVTRTHRLVIAHDAVKPFGFGAEVAAIVAEEALSELDAPIRRVAAPWAPLGTAPAQELAYYPGTGEIKVAIRSLFA